MSFSVTHRRLRRCTLSGADDGPIGKRTTFAGAAKVLLALRRPAAKRPERREGAGCMAARPFRPDGAPAESYSPLGRGQII